MMGFRHFSNCFKQQILVIRQSISVTHKQTTFNKNLDFLRKTKSYKNQLQNAEM